ncbi:MAG: hypothetical protein WDO19_23295 [Bacteroidota bacterium]
MNSGSLNYAAPNAGVSVIPEYSITTTGIKVITSSSRDMYGGFQTIPVINGYTYSSSVSIGSTSTSWDLHSPNGGAPAALPVLLRTTLMCRQDQPPFLIQ